MANTGRKIVLTLKQVTNPGGTPTGSTKPNTVSDPDYIAPYTDTVGCPITYNTTCPDVISTGLAGTVLYEFALLDSVIHNPAIAAVRVKLMQGATEIANNTYTLPHGNYFAGSFSGLTAGTYTITIELRNNVGTVLQSCPDADSLIVS